MVALQLQVECHLLLLLFVFSLLIVWLHSASSMLESKPPAGNPELVGFSLK
uniref:Uncharacterized protein n=1 Tax=Octopus bimaculoides TaxID=37653 RepID=A0A0L8G487_OCTBM